MKFLSTCIGSTVATLLLLQGCSGESSSSSSSSGSSSSSSSGEVDASTAADASKPAVDATVDSGKPVQCTQAEFDAADFRKFNGADVSFPFTASPKQYVNHCVKLKVGDQVTFAGDFTFHPLQRGGGEANSPIPLLTEQNPANKTLTITMTAVGNYGYECKFHPASMFGAIQVVAQ